MQIMQKRYGFGNTDLTALTYGKLIITALFILAFNKTSNCQDYAIICYDSSTSSNGFHPIMMKFVDLQSKLITGDILIGNDGEIIDPTPARIIIPDDTVLIGIIPKGCICKNTNSYGHNSNIILVSLHNRQIIRTINRPDFLYIRAKNISPTEFYIYATNEINPENTIRSVFTVNRNRILQKLRDVPNRYNPNLVDSIGVFEYPSLIERHFYYSVYNGYNYIIKADNQDRFVSDTLRCRISSDSNQLFAIKDSLLYVFALNYETHLSGQFYKGYGDEWIDNHVNIYSLTDFARRDSLAVPDYPRGDFINGKTGVADVMGPFIVYYFGDSNDISQLYPAMLFIFDTRTNQATWLRVGWR